MGEIINLNKLRGKRVELGFSQEELAKLLSINPVTYQRKESGVREFTSSELSKLGSILKLTLREVNDIFFGNTLT